MIGVLRKLNQIDSSNKKVIKIELLRDFLRNDELFRKVVVLTASGTMHFNIKTLPVILKNKLDLSREETLSELFKHLDYLSKQRGATAKDKKWIAELAYNLEGGINVVNRMLNGKLKCGVTSKSVNKAWPGLIESVPYMRCSTESKIGNIDYKNGAYFDEKLDGMFFNILVQTDGSIRYLSRNGKKYEVKNERLDRAFIKRSKGFGVAWTGEGRIYRNGKFLDRQTGNGIITKILKGTAKPEDHRDLVITVWEALPLKDYWNGVCNVPLLKRYNSKFFDGLTTDKGIIRVPFRRIVWSEEEALDLANEFIENGGEGGVIKNLDSIWKDGTSAHWIKIKAVVDVELVVVGWEYGKAGDKYEHVMGKIFCQSSDGMVKVRVGGGFTDQLRNDTWDDHIGSIVTIRFSQMTSSKKRVAKSLYLPRFVEFRDDKYEADDYKTIVRLIKEAKKKSASKK